MTDKEKAVVMAYTGICMLTGEKFSIYHKYIEELMGRPVFTHELANAEMVNQITEKSKEDFLKLCKDEFVPESCDDCISRAGVEQTVEDNILCYTHSDRPIDQDPDTDCHMAIRTALRMLRKDLRKLPPVTPRSLNPEADREESKAYCAECDHIEMCSWYPHDGCEWLKTDRYNAGYNAAKREIALSGEYERAYERGKADAQPKQSECEDVISREDALMCMTGEFLPFVLYKPEDIISKRIQRIKDLPPVQPKISTGKWIYKNYNWYCSECENTPKTLGYVGTAEFMKEHFKFCNHCGAMMIDTVMTEDERENQC